MKRVSAALRPLQRTYCILLVLLAGCSEAAERGAADSSPLLVMAAASLGEVMPALIGAFEAESGTPVNLVLGASGNLATQIVNGAPADLFFSADAEIVGRLAEQGAMEAATLRTFAVGELALVWRAGLAPPPDLHAIGDARYEVVAIANPAIAPYGAAAREALHNLGIWAAVQPRIVLGESVAQTYQFVRTGNADVGIVARSLTIHEERRWLPIDPALHEPLHQAAGVVTGSTHPAAATFLDFVVGPSGQAILRQYGFARPGG